MEGYAWCGCGRISAPEWDVGLELLVSTVGAEGIAGGCMAACPVDIYGPEDRVDAVLIGARGLACCGTIESLRSLDDAGRYATSAPERACGGTDTWPGVMGKARVGALRKSAPEIAPDEVCSIGWVSSID